MFLFLHVPGFSGMFRNVPGCSMFLVLSTPLMRMVFKSLETFLNRFNFPSLMRCKAKLLEILLRPSHTNFWLSKT